MSKRRLKQARRRASGHYERQVDYDDICSRLDAITFSFRVDTKRLEAAFIKLHSMKDKHS